MKWKFLIWFHDDVKFIQQTNPNFITKLTIEWINFSEKQNN